MSSTSSTYSGSGASVYNKESPLGTIVDQINAAFDPLPLDRAQVAQAQLSGALRAQTQELEQLRATVAERAAECRPRVLAAKKLGVRIAADLDWLNRHLQRLEARARSNHPIEFQQAREEVENPHVARRPRTP